MEKVPRTELAEAAGERPFAVLRVIVNTPHRELLRVGTIPHGLRAPTTLCRIAPAFETWSRTVTPTTVKKPYGSNIAAQAGRLESYGPAQKA